MFKLNGGGVSVNIFAPAAVNYQPNAWSIMKALNFNLIVIGDGVEGDVYKIGIDRFPEQWAQNLDRLLSDASRAGIKVATHTLGTKWNSFFDATCPNPAEGVVGTPIAEAKSKVDKLAGDNPISHNFLTDPRMLYWAVANEVDLMNPTAGPWCMELLDYIRAKGGKATVEGASMGGWGGGMNWDSSCDLNRVEPVLRGHADYLCIHRYGISNAAMAIAQGLDVYNAVYGYMAGTLRENLANLGTFSIDQLILSEFGIWRGGPAHDMGITATFSDENRRDYYKAVLDAARDLGILNVCQHDCFAQFSISTQQLLSPLYSIVHLDGTRYPLVADLVQERYTPTPTPILPLALGVGAVILVGGIAYYASRRKKKKRR